MNSKMFKSWFLLVALLLFSSCDYLFDPFHYGWGGDQPTKTISKIYFAADTIDPRRMPPFPAYIGSQIFSINPDGTELKQLTKYPGDEQPSVSKDGKRIVFVGWSRVMTFIATGKDLFVMNTDGKNERWLTNLNSNSDDYDPAISPDGQYVAFISTCDGNTELYVGNIDERNARPIRVTKTDSVAESSPAWSPDGKWLTYITRRGRIEPTTLWMTLNPTWPHVALAGWKPPLINITDSVRVRNASFVAKYNVWETPDWSPDGKLIAFSAHYEGVLAWYILHGIFSVNPFTYKITTMVIDSNLSKRSMDPYDPNWSPDGKQIVVSTRISVEGYQLNIYDANGGWKNAINPGTKARYWQADWGTYARSKVEAEISREE